MTEPNGKALVRTQQDPMFIMALEPTSFAEAFSLCKMAVASHLLPRAVQTPEAAMMILMRGRELGLTAMQAFSSIHVIDGKTSLSAELIVALIKRATDLCSYFSFIGGDATQATFETKRIGDPQPTRLTFTWKMAENLQLAGKDNWKKQPENMLRWRCATALARLVYPELTIGIYSNEEIEDIDPQANRGPNVIDAPFEVMPTPKSSAVADAASGGTPKTTTAAATTAPGAEASAPVTFAEVPPANDAPPPKPSAPAVPLADRVRAWRTDFAMAVTVSDCDKVRRDVRKHCPETDPIFLEMKQLYQQKVHRLRNPSTNPEDVIT